MTPRDHRGEQTKLGPISDEYPKETELLKSLLGLTKPNYPRKITTERKRSRLSLDYNKMEIDYSITDLISQDEVIELYDANGWSSGKKPGLLMDALKGSHSVVTARHGSKLVGLGNAISDGHLVVYYPHLLVLPTYQRMGIGKEIMNRMKERYGHFHQQQLTADGQAIKFYESLGFERSGKTEPMWIYQGNEH